MHLVLILLAASILTCLHWTNDLCRNKKKAISPLTDAKINSKYFIRLHACSTSLCLQTLPNDCLSLECTASPFSSYPPNHLDFGVKSCQLVRICQKSFPTTFGREVTTHPPLRPQYPTTPTTPHPSGSAVPLWPSSNLVFCCFYSHRCETMKEPLWAANTILHSSTYSIS